MKLVYATDHKQITFLAPPRSSLIAAAADPMTAVYGRVKDDDGLMLEPESRVKIAAALQNNAIEYAKLLPQLRDNDISEIECDDDDTSALWALWFRWHIQNMDPCWVCASLYPLRFVRCAEGTNRWRLAERQRRQNARQVRVWKEVLFSTGPQGEYFAEVTTMSQQDIVTISKQRDNTLNKEKVEALLAGEIKGGETVFSPRERDYARVRTRAGEILAEKLAKERAEADAAKAQDARNKNRADRVRAFRLRDAAELFEQYRAAARMGVVYGKPDTWRSFLDLSDREYRQVALITETMAAMYMLLDDELEWEDAVWMASPLNLQVEDFLTPDEITEAEAEHAERLARSNAEAKKAEEAKTAEAIKARRIAYREDERVRKERLKAEAEQREADKEADKAAQREALKSGDAAHDLWVRAILEGMAHGMRSSHNFAERLRIYRDNVAAAKAKAKAEAKE